MSLAERAGVADADRRARIAEVLAEVAAEGVEVVRLSFADQHGILRAQDHHGRRAETPAPTA